MHKILAFLTAFTLTSSGLLAADPLPSWNGIAPKRAIIAFVERVTDEGGSGFVPLKERIAVFDNDGTLWAEQPAYFQLLFAIDRVKALAPQHPEWKGTEPFKSVLAGDMKSEGQRGRDKGDILLILVLGEPWPKNEVDKCIVLCYALYTPNPRPVVH